MLEVVILKYGQSLLEFKFQLFSFDFIRLLSMHTMPKLARRPFVSTEMFILVSLYLLFLLNLLFH